MFLFELWFQNIERSIKIKANFKKTFCFWEGFLKNEKSYSYNRNITKSK